jgi:hypothetical protein
MDSSGGVTEAFRIASVGPCFLVVGEGFGPPTVWVQRE